MASVAYNVAKLAFLEGTRNWETVAAMKMILLKAVTTTPDNPDHLDIADVVADETSDTNYTGGFAGAGRKALGSRAATQNDTDDRAEFDFADITWTSLGGTDTMVFAVEVVEITNDASSPLFVAHDIANTLTDGSDFTLQVGSTGAVHVT